MERAENGRRLCDQGNYRPRGTPFLSVVGAKRHIRTVLGWRFENAYAHGSFKRIAGCERRARTRGPLQ